MKVQLSLSGTYPYYAGGVSTWAHQVVTGLPDVDFRLIGLVSNPNVSVRFQLPANVQELTTVPLWGVGRPEEFQRTSLWTIVARRRRTGSREIEREFLPHYEIFWTQCRLAGVDAVELGHALTAMARFFQRYDFYATMRSATVWDTIQRMLAGDALFRHMSFMDAVQLSRRMERLLRVLTVWPQPADVAHAAIAGLAGVPAVIAKIAYGVPFLLTEHGVYYRERLLDLMNEPRRTPLRVFFGHFEHAIVRLNYAFADLIAPVCRFNRRWERAMGVPPGKVRVIYNGVDPARFSPNGGSSPSQTVASVGRVDRLKDILTLIEAMAFVHEEMPDVRCLVYGGATDHAYRRLCLKRVEALGLSDVVIFCGTTDDPVAVYRQADVVVNSSRSEGFPFGILEAMACGKMVVATDVGGVREALEGCGVLVPPGAPKLLGQALAEALRYPQRREQSGIRSRHRVLKRYHLDRMLGAYRDVYRDLAAH